MLSLLALRFSAFLNVIASDSEAISLFSTDCFGRLIYSYAPLRTGSELPEGLPHNDTQCHNQPPDFSYPFAGEEKFGSP